MQIINLDLSVRSIIPTLYAKQGDVGRKFKVILTDGGAAYPVPAGAAVSVWYSGASGEGNYTEIGADSAVSVSGNEITVELITQMLTNPGDGMVCLVINTADGDELGTWNIPYCTQPRPGMGSAAAQAYFTAFSQAVENLPYPDASLSVKGRAADAGAVGTALAGKAPAGFGLGTSSYTDKSTSLTTKEQLDTLTGNGFWAYRNTTDPLIPGDNNTRYVHGLHYQYSGPYAVQTGYCVYNGTRIKRVRVDSDWYDWEYENPPMILGVEYRTTQRYNGKVVYVQAVNTGSFPNTSTKRLDTAALTYPIYQPLMAYGISSVDNRTIPHGEYIKLRMGWGYIEITTTDDYSSDSAVLTVWYIKE